MSELFQEHFTIKIDTSKCTSLIAGTDIKLKDTWYYSDQSFESGKIYGLVSEYGQGCMYLSYLLGGRVNFENVKIYCNDILLTRENLSECSHNLESYNEAYGKKTVKASIEKVLKQTQRQNEFQSIAEKFMLTPERYDRKFKYLSGERWRADAAFGYAQNKKIFFAPYKTSTFYRQMCQCGLLKCLRELTRCGALVVLPVGSDGFMKHIADEIIYLDRYYNQEGYNDKYKNNDY